MLFRSGSACHQSIATHSDSQTKLKVIRAKFDALNFGIHFLNVHNCSNKLSENCLGFAAAAAAAAAAAVAVAVVAVAVAPGSGG